MVRIRLRRRRKNPFFFLIGVGGGVGSSAPVAAEEAMASGLGGVRGTSFDSTRLSVFNEGSSLATEVEVSDLGSFESSILFSSA